MNRFYQFVNRLIANTVAKSTDVNNIVDGISGAFDSVQGELNRALKLPVGDNATEHNFAENPTQRAGKLLQFDPAGNPIASNVLGSDVDAGTKRIFNLPFAVLGSAPVTLDQLNAFSGNLAGLPPLAGEAGMYLRTDGSTVYWATIPAIPSQDNTTANKFLMSNGASAAWTAVPNTVPGTTDQGVSFSHDGTTFGFRREAHNLILNACGAVNYNGGATVFGWTGPLTGSLGGHGWRMVSGLLGTFTGAQECSSFPYGGGIPIAVSADVDTSLVTSGTVSLVVDFHDASDNSISTSSLVIPNAHALGRFGFSVPSTPANCTQIRVRLVLAAVTTTGPLQLTRVKAERNTTITPFNDAATIAWAAGYRQLTELGRGYTSPIVRVGDATSTSSAVQLRSAAGTQSYDAAMTVTGGTNGTNGKGDVVLDARTFKAAGVIGYTREFDAGASAAAVTIDFTVNGARQKLLLNAAAPAITINAPPMVGNYRIKLLQDGTGGRVPTFNGTAVTWAGGVTPLTGGYTPQANGVCFVDLYFDGATLWGSWTPW